MLDATRWIVIASVLGFISTGCAGENNTTSKKKSTGHGGTSSGGAAGNAGTSTGATGGVGGAGGQAGTGGEAGTGGVAGNSGASGASGNAGSSGSAGNAGSTQDPCGGVPTTGECLDNQTVSTCVVATGQAAPQVVTQSCGALRYCDFVAGQAQCVLDANTCEPSSSVCVSTSVRADCDASGTLVSSPCAQCADTPVGAVCRGAVPTTTVSGAFSYEARLPNAAFTGWASSTFSAPVQGALVVSYRQSGTGYAVVDSTTTASDGSYSLHVANPPGANDLIQLYAARPTAGGASVAFMVAMPDVADGQANVVDPIENGTPWSWAAYVSDVTGTPGGSLLIPESSSSGAMRVFDYARYVYDVTSSILGASGDSLVIWLRYNTSWSCGACANNTPVHFGAFDFNSQIWLPATAQDTSYWSDPVTAHELGHWVMSSFGTSPHEGGPHSVSCPTFPGQAWSEGWATGFSSLTRSNPVYYDKQQGTFFWFDISQREYSQGVLWPRPIASDGLDQLIDENEVASMIWGLANHPASAQQTLPSNLFLFDALRSPRMTLPPFARGYTRHSWGFTSGCAAPNYGKTNVVDLGESRPMFADFLDALRCNGVAAGAVDAVTEPSVHYPYPSGAPFCN